MYKKRNAFRDLASEPETRVGGIISEDIFFLSRVNGKFKIFFNIDRNNGTRRQEIWNCPKIYSEY